MFVIVPQESAYGVKKPIMAMENLTATTLRNIIGDMELDATLTSREAMEKQMKAEGVIGAVKEDKQ